MYLRASRVARGIGDLRRVAGEADRTTTSLNVVCHRVIATLLAVGNTRRMSVVSFASIARAERHRYGLDLGAQLRLALRRGRRTRVWWRC